VRTTPTNPFEPAANAEVTVRKGIIARRIQEISAGMNKGRKSDHYLVVWEGYPLKRDHNWQPHENLYHHETLIETYEQWLKINNARLDNEESQKKTSKKLTTQE
jgi:hypothetical protein